MSSFTEDLDVRLRTDGSVVLLRDLTYLTDWPDATFQVRVPVGFTFDGASVPRWAWPMVHPLSATIIRAATVHDWLYHHKKIRTIAHDGEQKDTEIGRATADMIFRQAMFVDQLLERDGRELTGLHHRWTVTIHWVQRWLVWLAVRVFASGPWERTTKNRLDQAAVGQRNTILFALSQVDTSAT